MWNWLLPNRPPNAADLEAARAAAESSQAAAVNAGQLAAGVAASSAGRPAAAAGSGGHPSASSFTAFEVRRQADAELKANDAYWAKRLAQLEQSHQKAGAVREREFNAAVSFFAARRGAGDIR